MIIKQRGLLGNVITDKEIIMETNTNNRDIYLLIGGWFSLAFAVFQVSAVVWPPALLSYFDGPVKMQAEYPLIYFFGCVFVGALAAVAGFYALSGASIFRRLPLLRTGLVTITVVYILRGFGIIQDIIFQVPPRLALFSLIALCIGMIHLMGVIRLFRKK